MTVPSVLRLLHIEDDPADAMLMQAYIRQSCQDWNLSLAESSPTGDEAAVDRVVFDSAERLGEVTTVRAHEADCAILDLSLPDASGLQALIALRAMCQELPIVVLTGFDDFEVGLAAIRCGADDYLVKSQIDGFTLDRAVRYAMARRELATEHAAAAAAATVAVISDAVKQASAERVAQ